MSSGNKYHRTIVGIDGNSCVVDVYAVIVAFDVKCPARQHALKKVLCAGIRGKGGERQDLTESIDAIKRAVDLCSPVVAELVNKPLDIRPASSDKDIVEKLGAMQNL
jgi:hypothetical protein